MARPLRIEFPGAVYHVTSRGNGKQFIYKDDRDRYKFLEILASVVKEYNWLCHAYCLMGNHYHLLVETPEGNLSAGMRQLNGVFTQAFNRHHGTVGHLLQGRYKAIIVQKEAHLLELCRYIVLNPVRACLTDNPATWRWSSYQATAGHSWAPSFLTRDWILGHFAKKIHPAERGYEDFVAAGMNKSSPWPLLRHGFILGDDVFLEHLQQLNESVEVKEVPRIQRMIGRPSIAELFENATTPGKPERNAAIREARKLYGYSMKEIADEVKIHYTTVSKILRSAQN